MACTILASPPSTSNPATSHRFMESCRGRACPAAGYKESKPFAGNNSIDAFELLDAHQPNQPEHVRFWHIIQRPLILFFKSFPQILRGNKTRFPVRQVAPRLITEFHKRRMRQSHNVRSTFHKKFCIDRVAMPGCYAIPHMRKTAVIQLPAQFRSDFKHPHKLAHRSSICKYRPCRHKFPSSSRLLYCALLFASLLSIDSPPPPSPLANNSGSPPPLQPPPAPGNPGPATPSRARRETAVRTASDCNNPSILPARSSPSPVQIRQQSQY